jgi:hypothetical protein
MTEQYLEFLTTDLITYVQTNLGTGTSSDTAIAHVKAGMVNVYNCVDTRMSPPRRYNWSFLQTAANVTFSYQTTGTATGQGSYSAVTGHTTLTASAVFNSSMVSHSVTFTLSGTAYEIVSYTSATVVVLEGNASAETSGDTFTVDHKGVHAVPTGFSGIKVPPVWMYSASAAGTRYRMERRSPADIRAMWRDDNQGGDTRYWALEATTFANTATQGYQFLVHPVPTEDMVATMQVFLRINDPVTAKYVPGGPLVGMAIRDASLADAEIITGAVQGVWAAKAQASLWAAIDADQQTIAATTGPERLRRA